MTLDIERISAQLAEIEIGTPMEDGQLFDNIFYLTNHIDVLESNFHPYDHFIKHGRLEGRAFKTLDPSTLSNRLILRYVKNSSRRQHHHHRRFIRRYSSGCSAIIGGANHPDPFRC